MNDVSSHQIEPDTVPKNRARTNKLVLSLLVIFACIIIFMLARAVYARYNDKLAVQVICTSDGTAICPLERFVCSNEGGILADGILMFGATQLDFLSEMPVIAPKHELTVTVKPSSWFTECNYSFMLINQNNVVVYNGDRLDFSDLKELPPATYYLVIKVSLTRGDTYKSVAFFALIDISSGVAAGDAKIVT